TYNYVLIGPRNMHILLGSQIRSSYSQWNAL
ncbi:unnamed protein product, partial [Allacma fusca]